MSAWSNLVERLRGFEPERMLGLRAAPPPVAIELDATEALLVRLKRRRRGPPLLEAHETRPLEPGVVPHSMFNGGATAPEGLAAQLHQLFESSGTRPGRVALVLPDNLAKVSLLHLPERPPTRQQLEQIIRFKMRRAVPFRLDEANLSYQVLPAEGKAASILVALVRRGTLENFEKAVEGLGGRPGRVSLSTPSLVNLCRTQLDAAAGGGDAALLNCARNYFSLVITRGSRLIFFRCKTWLEDDESGGVGNGFLARELAGSLSYYQEKLEGRRLAIMLVRSVGQPAAEVAARLSGLAIDRVEPLDAAAGFELPPGTRLPAEAGHRLAAAVGATSGGA